MLILAVDTALAACSIALFDSARDRVLAHALEPMETGQAERLPGMVAEGLERAGVAISACDRFAATSGPGTFTGIRIGLAFIRGLALALDRPALGIPTLEAIAAAVTDNASGRTLAVSLDARRDEVYIALFGEAPAPARLVSLAEAVELCRDRGVLLAGTGAPLLLPHLADARLSAASPLPDALTVARLAATSDPELAPPDPFYLRKPDAKLPLAVAPVEPAAAGVLAALHAECFTKPWHAQEWASLMAMPGTTALLARLGSEPAGFLLARHAAGEVEILTIGTRHDRRRLGIARTMIGTLEARERGRGSAAIFIEVAPGNIAARALYAGLGFRQTGRRPAYYANGDDALILRRDLA